MRKWGVSSLNEHTDETGDIPAAVNGKKVSSNTMGGKHMLMMVLCCAIPLVAVAVLLYLGLGGKYLIYVVMLLCPLLHFVMMRGMHGTARDGE